MRCSDCKYFAAVAQTCHRNPPVPVPIQTGPGDFTVLGAFPGTKPESFCGEFQWAEETRWPTPSNGKHHPQETR